MNLVPASHIGVQSPTFASHVGDISSTFASHVEDHHPASASHVGGNHPASVSHVGEEIPFTASHIGDRSIVSMIHVIDPSPTSASHVGDVQPTTTSHVGSIDYVEKPRWVGRKPKFPCKLCKGDHLTHMCPGIPEVQILWSMCASASDSESSEVSSQPIQLMVEKLVMPMQYSVDPTPIFGGEVPLDHVVL
jgi:hypothetical protein